MYSYSHIATTIKTRLQTRVNVLKPCVTERVNVLRLHYADVYKCLYLTEIYMKRKSFLFLRFSYKQVLFNE